MFRVSKLPVPPAFPLFLAIALAAATLPARGAASPAQQIQKPMAGPRATALQITSLYVEPDPNSQRVDKVQIGREMVVAEKSGPWLRVYANTDIQEMQDQEDEPMVGGNETPPPISGWLQAKGIVEEATPNGDQIIMGAAANEEDLASNPRGPANSAQAAELLYRRVAEMFPNSPLAGEAAWRAADIRWQLQKADISTLPSAKEQQAYMRPRMNEDPLHNVVKHYPRTRWAALAAFDLIDDKLCGNWEGSTKCPEKEADLYEKYADEFPDGPRTAQALYDAVYRMAVLANMYSAGGDKKKGDGAADHARALTKQMQAHFADSDYTWRASALVYKLDEDIPVYGIDLN
jgi:hypothetical protein